MSLFDKYLILAIGVVFAGLGIVLFVKKSVQGSNKIKILAVEFELSTPSLIVFVVGAALIVFPFTQDVIKLEQAAGGDAAVEPNLSAKHSDKPVRLGVNIDAAMDYSRRSGVLYLTSGNRYWGVDVATLQRKPGFPASINHKTWPGLPFRSVDAIVKWQGNLSYVFKGGEYAIYDEALNRLHSGPMPIDEHSFPGLSFTRIDAAVNWGDGMSDYIYLFSGNSYVRFSKSRNKVDAGYPKYINNSTWPELGFEQVDAVAPISATEALFFYRDKYVHYSIQDDKAVSAQMPVAKLIN